MAVSFQLPAPSSTSKFQLHFRGPPVSDVSFRGLELLLLLGVASLEP